MQSVSVIFLQLFKVYDDQDSGDICFGIENKGRKIFVKFAGAQIAEYNGDVFGAIQTLKATVPIYKSIKQKSLIQYITSEEIDQGFAMMRKILRKILRLLLTNYWGGVI